MLRKFTLLAAAFFALAQEAPLLSYTKRPTYDAQAAALDSLQDSFRTVQHRLGNQEADVKAFEQRLNNFELMMESLREDSERAAQEQKSSSGTKAQSLELRIESLEQAKDALTADIKQLAAHANETVQALKTCKQKLGELEGAISQQNRNVSNLQTAVSSLAEAFQLKSELNDPLVQGRTYKIKTGDSLEKIARAHQTTVQAIKEINGMASDKIIIGKTIKIPD